MSRIWSQQQLGYVEHTSISGNVWTLQRRGTTTGAGAAGGTTLLDTSLGGANDDYNGRYWIEMLTGVAKGQMKRIVDYVAATGSCTLENNGFNGLIGSGDTYNLWLSPEPVIVIDTTTDESNAVDGVRLEANDYWNGYYAVPITGFARGTVAAITDFVTGTGTFTFASGLTTSTGTLVAGDVLLLRKFVEARVDAPGITEEYIPRVSPRVNFSVGDGSRGPRGGTFGFSTQIRASGTLAAAAAVANKSTLSGLFQACGLVEAQDTSSTAAAGCTTTAIKIDTASWEHHTVGGMIMWDGNCAFIDTLNDGAGAEDTINVTPALPAAPAAGDVIHASCMYRKSLDGDLYGVTVEWEVDGVRHTMTGCKGNVAFVDGAAPELAWTLNVDHYIREIEAAPYNAVDAYSATPPVLAQERIAYLDSTKVDIKGFTASPTATAAPRNVQGATGFNGRAGYHLSGYDAGGTWQEIVDSAGQLTQEERWLERTSAKLAVIYGSHEQCFAVRIPAARQIVAPHPVDGEGLMEAPCVFNAQDAGSAVDGDVDLQKTPDFAFYLT